MEIRGGITYQVGINSFLVDLFLVICSLQMRDSQMAVPNEFFNSAALPLEVQLMGAKPQRSQALDDCLSCDSVPPVRVRPQAPEMKWKDGF